MILGANIRKSLCLIGASFLRLRPLIKAGLCASLLLFVIACAPPKSVREVYLFDGATMGTTYQIKAVPSDKSDIAHAKLAQKIDAALLTFNQQMSTYIDNSELSLANRAPLDRWIPVSEPLFHVLDISQKVSLWSGGAFDITVGPLVNLWGFGPVDRKGIPNDDEIASVLSTSVGHRFVELDSQAKAIKKSAPVTMDLSAVAKGYATDVLAKLLERHQISDYMIEIGGELFISGQNAKGQQWTIGVEKPTVDRSGAIQAISGDGIGIATSGDYRNYYEEGGQRISHTLNPRTGRPIEHFLLSVTVVTDSGGMADALATALNVLGPDTGYALALDRGLAAFFIYKENGELLTKHSPAFEQYMVQ
ncbi:MAG: FAD:protein FMN transferase ApbE [Alteromonadaceae bacterium]|nr:MAG: FAD:protein FMN transferase ApbE [Alteromonadaceae bacterium]